MWDAITAFFKSSDTWSGLAVEGIGVLIELLIVFIFVSNFIEYREKKKWKPLRRLFGQQCASAISWGLQGTLQKALHDATNCTYFYFSEDDDTARFIHPLDMGAVVDKANDSAVEIFDAAVTRFQASINSEIASLVPAVFTEHEHLREITRARWSYANNDQLKNRIIDQVERILDSYDNLLKACGENTYNREHVFRCIRSGFSDLQSPLKESRIRVVHIEDAKDEIWQKAFADNEISKYYSADISLDESSRIPSGPHPSESDECLRGGRRRGIRAILGQVEANKLSK